MRTSNRNRLSCLAIAVAMALFAIGQASAQIPDEFTNLKLFPKEIGKRDLLDTMKKFSGALGVRCSHCHLAKTPGSLEGMDFATDELEAKRVTRAMMKMTGEINGRLLPTTGRPLTLRVTCVTCHAGLARPMTLDDVLLKVAEKDGAAAAADRYRELRDEYYGSGSYDFGAGTLNKVAEVLAQERDDSDGAVAMLKLNLEHHPDETYSHTMLGYVYMARGDKEAAIASLERALELEPDNDRAKQMLQRLRSAE